MSKSEKKNRSYLLAFVLFLWGIHSISNASPWKSAGTISTCRFNYDHCSRTLSPLGKIGSSSIIESEDPMAEFLYVNSYVNRLGEMDVLGLKSAKANVVPWSDSFWPIAKGFVARRWADSKFPKSKNWIDNFSYFLSSPPEASVQEELSPSEKYDLLVGDDHFTLTQAAWNEGKKYFEKDREVPPWAGLCHGWAPASYMSRNPEKMIDVISVKGRIVRFYPSDIKALSSLAWGEEPPAFKMLGKRCKDRKPPEDEIGRVLDEECFDVNPGAWHLAVVNQVGINKGNFVFDATYDQQVWNYPIFGYSYHYFNPQTFETSNLLQRALVKRIQFRADRYSKYRSDATMAIVGIVMEVSYVVPTNPSVMPSITPSIHKIQYVYDLEIDRNDKIIGGEWYGGVHPDFIWNIPPDGFPLSELERQYPNTSWLNEEGDLNPLLIDLAPKSSLKMQPIAAVVRHLESLAGDSHEPVEGRSSQ